MVDLFYAGFSVFIGVAGIVTFVAVLGVAVVAAALPARRVTRIEISEALRAET